MTRRPFRKRCWSTTFESSDGSRRYQELQPDDAAAQGDGHRLRAVASPELLHNVLDVDLHCLFRDDEVAGDVAVPIAVGNLLEDGRLALGQRLVADVLGELRGHVRWNVLLAAMDPADDGRE